MYSVRKISTNVCALFALGLVIGLSNVVAGAWMATALHAQTIKKSAKAASAPKKNAGQAAVNQAGKLLNAGKTVKATALLNKAISAGGLASNDMARALYYRGVALRKQGKPAEAIADLTNALWLKNGLTPSLRKDAEANRVAARREAGAARATGRVVQTPAASTPGAVKQVPARQTQARQTRAARQAIPGTPPPATTGWQVQTRAAAPVPAPPKKSGGIAGFFSNLFSGGSKPTQPAPAATRPARQAGSKSPTAGGPQISAWNSATVVKGAAPATRRTNNKASVRRQVAPGQTTKRIARPKQKVAPRAVPAVPSRYRLILSPVRSVEKARANALAMQQKYAPLLANRRPVIESTSFGGSTFYQVRVGPFTGTKSPGSICTQLKASGVDCILSKL